jgi:NAD(P)-dependent dehydrogenase (short-subunit alcohol dehydrogenase family)
MTAAHVDKKPELLEKWSNLNPMGRIGRPDELRGVVTWLASDASSYCTGSEYVDLFFKIVQSLTFFKYLGHWWVPCMVNSGGRYLA